MRRHGHDVDAEVIPKCLVPRVPVCTSHWYKAKRLQVVVFKGVFFINLCLYQCTSIYKKATEIFYWLTVLTSTAFPLSQAFRKVGYFTGTKRTVPSKPVTH